jgi:tetratricopeptide (TPR) repeat protein
VETARPTTGVALTLFERHVKQALKLFDNPERLGRESPLASPYMLGRALHDLPRPVTAQARGQVLRAEIRAAAARLWRGPLPATRDEMLAAIAIARRSPDDPHYAYVVLELRCFHGYISLHHTSDIWEQPHLLPGSKSQHYRDFDASVKRLAPLLLDSLSPTLRPERPRAPEALIGYDKQLALLADALSRGRTIALNGPGGVGKTSIGAAAVGRLGGHPAFWYTLRPGFNDGASSLLFALGAFLHQRGASNLWQYLVTANGVVGDLNLAAGLLRQDLATFAEHPPIVCLDDLEHLYTSNPALITAAHAQLLDLIDGLRGTTPLLLISQRPLPPGDLHIELTGIGAADVARLWQAAGHELSSQQAERLRAYTGGNPRLLTLLLTLRHDAADEPFLDSDKASPSLLPAIQRLWRRLVPEERRALQRLSVYQGYAPQDVVSPPTLETLARLRLAECDSAGGVTVLPALAPIVHDDLSPELREKLHAQAAIVRLERGEYTAAAYHFAQSKQDKRAVQAWFPQRRRAIARGEADAARLIFGAISRQRLDKPERKALDIIRAELRQLAGQNEDAARELEQVDWSDESESSARLWMLRGELQDALGYPDQALESYGEGLRVTARLVALLAALRQRRGLLFLRRRNLERSWQEIRRAEFDLELLHGLLRDEEGAYDAALEAHCRARALADELDEDALRAQAERQIAGVYGRRQQLEEAVAHAAQAIAIYERLGDRVSLEKMRSNLSFIYLQTQQFGAALEAGAPAYAFFVAMHDPYFAALTGANLAEASFELGDLAAAARYATEALELGDRFAAPYARFTLGRIDLSRHAPAAAIANFSESMQLARQNDDPYLVAYAERSLGQAYLAAADFETAGRRLESALALFRQLGIAGEVAASQQLIADMQPAKRDEGRPSQPAALRDGMP